MSWSSLSIRISVFSMLGLMPAPDALQEALEDVREAMVAALGELTDAQLQLLARRIRYSNDAAGLWYLRSELMSVLARTRGEAGAAETLEAVSLMFADLLPGSMRSRRAHLRGEP